MRRCERCLLPETKPDLRFDSLGVCSACVRYERRPHVDWESRLNQLKTIVAEQKAKQKRWDCVVPVSGGKDSTYQVVTALQLGLRPLAVTSMTCDLSVLGWRNLSNIARLGVDHVVISPDARIRARLNRIGLMEVGDISWPEHVGIFTIPVQVAVERGIDLILWGENSQDEYGAGTDEAASRPHLDREWLEEHGGLLGLRVTDLSSTFGVNDSDLSTYRYPGGDDLAHLGLRGLFLGYFIPWDGRRNADVAEAHGFERSGSPVEGSGVDYENLDNYQTGIHDYFKYLKFGFGRATDVMSLQVRRGLRSRESACAIVRDYDGRYPHTYLGKPLDEIIGRIGVSRVEFDAACVRFTNTRLFEQGSDGKVVLRDDGSPKLRDDGGLG